MVRLENPTLTPLPRITCRIMTCCTEQSEPVPLPGDLVPQHAHMIAVVLTTPKLPIADRARVALRFIHFVLLLLGDRHPLRLE